MTSNFGIAMRQALQLTRAQNLMEATRVIQRALGGRGRDKPDRPAETARLIAPPADGAESAGVIEASLSPFGGERAAPRAAPLEAPDGAGPSSGGLGPPPSPAIGRPEGRPSSDGLWGEGTPPTSTVRQSTGNRHRRPLGEVLQLLRQADFPAFGDRAAAQRKSRKAPPISVPDGAAYHARTFAGETGSRDYKVYVPGRVRGRKLPMIVMLHGCTQNPDDFAAGTGMNRLAEESGFIVAYPQQSTRANPAACWNWFSPGDQMRDAGEPGIIAGITQSVMAEFDVDPSRVYVAGLSAGGAMAAIMSATYPELYAAAGVHSGLPHGAAADVPSAFAAMRGSANPAATHATKRRAKRRVRTIVFHGANDKTVDPSNAEAILADVRAGLADPAREARHEGFEGGRAYTRTIVTDARGVPHAECWAIDGLGHAWSGGSPEGSFTDSQGPDASREMLGFFLEAPAQPHA